MRVFPRINYPRLRARGSRHSHKSRGPAAGLARAGPRTLLLTIPPLLLIASVLAYAYAGSGALLVIALAAVVFAAAQSVALRRRTGRRPLQLSLQEGEDRRFLLDLSGGVRRLRECVASLSNLPAEEICARVVRRLDEWCAATPQHDDLTLVVSR